MKYYIKKIIYIVMYELYRNIKISQHIVVALYFLYISQTKSIKFIE